ncbi:MAG: condensation domain-containing protein, partial [Gemmatimonadaceae bacterium]
KIRGFRIELGEIENTLTSHARVKEAVVVARDDAAGEPRLVAYVVADGEAPSLAELRDHLQVTLPAYMVPAVFVWLAALPLSSNGKVDRRALPEPELDRAALSRAFVAPRTPAEKALAEIWQRVLRVEQVGVEDNLFELGGDSLLSVQIVSQARVAGLGLTLTQVLRHPTVGALARMADVAGTRAVHDEVRDAVPLTPIQHWFFESQHEHAHQWNQSFMFRVAAGVDAARMAQAVSAAVRHHDSLRLRFERGADGWHQRAVDALDDVLVEIVHGAPTPEACERVQASLNLASGPMIRVALFTERMLVAVHHLAIDGVSWRVLLEDIEAAYLGRALPEKTTPFTWWAREVGRAGAAARAGELSYWEGVGSPSFLALEKAEVHAPRFSRGDRTVALTPAETRQLLQDVPAAYNTQINDAFIAALAAAMGTWLGDGDLVVNVEGHGREDIVPGADVSRTTGWFTTLFPVRLRLGAAAPGDRLRETKEMLRGVPHRGVNYGLLRYLDGAETLKAQTTPEVVFNYLGQFDQALASSSMFAFTHEATGSWYGADSARPHALELNALVAGGKLELRWSYDADTLGDDTMSRVASEYLAALRAIIAHCTEQGAGGFTPSDFALARLTQAELDDVATAYPGVEDVYPLVPMQRLFLGYADPASDPGFEQWRYTLRGPLDARALRAAWDLVTERHAILRTAFATKGLREPMQVVVGDAALPWTEHDWRGLGTEEQGRRMAALLAADRAQGFAFDRAPLMRIALVRHADDEYELVWSNHHLLLDRWSWPLILLEIATAYPVLARGGTPVLEAAPRFADFVGWQQVQSLADARAFWARHFDGFVPPPKLVPAHADADVSQVEEVVAELSVAETTALGALARTRQVATNTLVAGAWALWLARRAGHDDISFGITVAGRDGDVAGIERMVGLTINNLPLRVQVAGNSSLGDWITSLHHSQAEMQHFAHAPLERVQEWSGVPWRTRLFDTLLVFQHDDAEQATSAWLGHGMETSLVHVPTHTAYPLSVIVAGGDALSLRVTFDQRYFDAPAAQAMANGMQAALRAMIAAPDATIAELLATLPEAEVSSQAPDRARDHVEPRTATESVLASIWSDVLGVERVGITENFFALGGYSLVATQIASRIRSTLQLEAPVRVLFANPTVAALAAALRTRERRPGELEKIARVAQRVYAMSLDELRGAGAARNATN